MPGQASSEKFNSILVLNGGSSSIKLSIFGANDKNSAPSSWTDNQACRLMQMESGEISELIKSAIAKSGFNIHDIKCVGHRVVHGGDKMRAAAVIDESVEAKIKELIQLAPVHNPLALKIIRAAKLLLPDALQVAVFDTAFHSDLKESAYIYALPYEWYEDFGIRRFGFHGINHKYCSEMAAKILSSELEKLKIVSCHLGNGCSLAAVMDAKCVGTSMGFTPLEGLMMGARSGSIDPGIIFYLLKEKGLSPEQVENALNNESGLLGVSGKSLDMREIIAAKESGNKRAKLAFDLFVRSICAGVAQMASYMNGINVLIFTAGIGEHSADLRAAVSKNLEFLGLTIDEELNKTCRSDSILSNPESKVKVLRIAAGEDLQIYNECLAIMASD
ncbi:MAG: acetate/propionate family kinase [Candidatus Obscuribacterales bacterium]|nr:acetate/propionate family kinase [Candidatus Obscuribacterales bacterium]